MAKTSVPCPNCHQPITIELTRLFDVNTDPEAKQKLLSGSANYYQCPICQHQGVYPTPLVYHDPEKELLLTFFPPELGVPVNEQERIIGPLIKKTVDDLVPEKRKAYLFRPQTMLTQQRLFETILQADGITPEMIKAQQEKLGLIQTLASASIEALPELILQNDDKIDEELFLILSRLAQASAAGGDQESTQLLANLQQSLLKHSTFGKAAAAEAEETRSAMNELQELSKAGLTREKLLDLLINSSDSDIKVSTIATLARGGLDYEFFQKLTDKIENSKDDQKKNLESLRDKLLTITQEVDQAVKAQLDEAKKLVDSLLEAEDIEKATQEALPMINQAVADVINAEAAAAQSANDEAKLKKIATIISIIQSASQSGLYMQLVEELLQAPDQAARKSVLEEAGDSIDDEFTQMLSGLVTQIEQQENQPEMANKLKELFSEVLKFKMTRNLKGN